MVQELVIISGKGGTGKTSIVSSFAHLAESKVMADCDVDAADLHLILSPEIKESHEYKGGKIATLDIDTCIQCDKCINLCRFDAIDDTYTIDPVRCEGCGVCAHFCPTRAITLHEKVAGNWYISDTRAGTMVHARLNIAEDNSGKLVTEVKKNAKRLAVEQERSLVIVDGPPGTGCPVISAISGATLVLVVTEPTVSGLHDLKRVLELANHFHIGAAVAINKYDLYEEGAADIEAFCEEKDVPVLGRIPYDLEFSKAQVEALSLVEHSDGQAAQAVRSLWNRVEEALRDKSS